ncbi:hypothetical protein D6817_01495, partial [Candidatus Pacearchaeota archaeon]
CRGAAGCAGASARKKRRNFFAMLIFIALFVLALQSFTRASAQGPQGLGGIDVPKSANSKDIIEKEFGVKKEYVPSDTQDIQELRDNLLRKQWEEFINNSKTLKAVNSFLSKLSPVFYILTRQHYEFSPRFYGVLFLWIFILVELNALFRSAEFPSKSLAFPAALTLTVLVAWTNFISFVVSAVLDVIFNPKRWWVRLIIFVVVLLGFALTEAIARSLREWLKKRREEKIKKEGERSARRLAEIDEERRRTQQELEGATSA